MASEGWQSPFVPGDPGMTSALSASTLLYSSIDCTWDGYDTMPKRIAGGEMVTVLAVCKHPNPGPFKEERLFVMNGGQCGWVYSYDLIPCRP